MVKNLKIISLLVISLVLATGCGTIPTLENGEEAVVQFENDDKISVDDLYKEVKDTYALEALITMVDKQIFETKFKDYVEEATEYTDSYIESMLASYGTEEDLLVAIQQSTNYSTIEGYKEYIYISYMQNHAAEEYAEDQITEDQIQKYYDEVVKGDIELNHILIVPDATTEMTEDEIAAAEDAADATINEIIGKLNDAKNNGEDIEEAFSKLASEYSEDDSTKDSDGSLGKISYGDLSSAYDQLIDAGYEISDGNYTTEVIITELGYHVVLKTASHEKESLEDLEDEVLEQLVEDLMTTDTTITFDALLFYREEHGLDIIDSELGKQYNEYINNLKASLEEQATVE